MIPRRFLFIAAAGLAFVPPIPADASLQEAPQSAVRTNVSQKVIVKAGSSVVIDTARKLKRASVANPDVADVVVLSPQQLYAIGKNMGSTTLTLWDEHDRVSVFDVEVTPDQAQLKEKLKELLPREDITVQAINGHVTLSGTLSSVEAQNQALALARAFSSEKVINLLQVGKKGSAPQPVEDHKVELIKGIKTNVETFSSEPGQ